MQRYQFVLGNLAIWDMHINRTNFVKFMLGLLIFFVCISVGFVLFYSEVYEFVVVKKFRVSN